MKLIIEAALLGLSVEITRNTGIDIPGIKRETKGKIERKSRKVKQELPVEIEEAQELPNIHTDITSGRILVKTSIPNEFKMYFEKIAELADSGIEFPVDLDILCSVIK
jgi:MinD-like ATPase involved in chromosome partitioning or flagellar assembly